MRYLIHRGGPLATAWRPVVLLAVLGLTTACREDEPTGPRVSRPSGPLVSIAGASLTGLPFVGVAINDAGQVAGTQNPGEGPAGAPPPRAMLYTPGVGVQDLGTLGGTRSEAYALNEQGQVVGYSTTATGARHAFLWTPGVGMQDLGVLAGGLSSTARGINDRGEVVGQSTLPPVAPRNPETHAFLWAPSSGMEDLGALGGEFTSSVAYAINDGAQVVGRSYSADRIIPPDLGFDPEFYSRAFLWTPGVGMRDLGALGTGYAVAYGINDAGLVVGKSWPSTVPEWEYGRAARAVLWEPGPAIRDLGALWAGPSNSAATGINEAGQVVGTSDLGIAFQGFPLQAFLWSAANGLEALFPTTGLTTARDINNRQQVVGDERVATLHLPPGNDRPMASIGGPYTGTEGTPVELNLSARDNNDVGLTYAVTYGDGQASISLTSRGFKHLYADNGTYTLTLTVQDPKGASDTKTTTVTIANVAPTILANSLTGPTTPIALAGGRASAPISFEFSDMGGKHDVYTAEVACGDSPVVLTVHDIPVSETHNQNGDYLGGRGTFRGVCTYTSAGFYTVTARVSDEDGGTSGEETFSPVIVFDRASSTRGSGFYSVPGQGNRKAHFTFDASYPGGGTLPNGAVKFWIPGLEKNFESSTIELLVVSGNRAQFWGTGTLNGAPARFRITAIDGNAHHDGVADAIRVELWDASGTTLLYDTQPGATQDAPVTTPIDGGNIQIRRG